MGQNFLRGAITDPHFIVALAHLHHHMRRDTGFRTYISTTLGSDTFEIRKINRPGGGGRFGHFIAFLAIPHPGGPGFLWVYVTSPGLVMLRKFYDRACQIRPATPKFVTFRGGGQTLVTHVSFW